MLNRLSVENYALIDRLDIELAAGLNIVTGETGAGKSILLGALGLILGNRTDAAAIKNSQRNCVIEAEFDVDGYGLRHCSNRWTSTTKTGQSSGASLRREEKSRAYVNDIPVQMNTLREIGSRLIDIHSQHQTPAARGQPFPDRYRGQRRFARRSAVALQGDVRCAATIRTRTEPAAATGRSERPHREYLAFQSDELQKAKLKEGEQAELEAQQTELSHAAEIKDTLLWISQEMTGADENLLGRIKEIEVSLGRIARVYPAGRRLLYPAAQRRARPERHGLRDRLRRRSLEADPQRLESVSQRLDLIYSLQQKHKADSVETLLALQDDYQKRLAQLEGSAQAIETLSRRIGELRVKAAKQAAEITAGRKKTVPHVESRSKRCSQNWECRRPSCVSESRRQRNCNPTARTTSAFCSRPTATCRRSRSNESPRAAKCRG